MAGRSTRSLGSMQPGPFWNRYIALWVATISIAVAVITLNIPRDDAVVFGLLALPIIAVGTIAHAWRNKIVFYIPWPFRSYKFTTFERWVTGTGVAIFVSYFIVDVFIKHGK